MSRSEIALENFKKGYNCAQSVLITYCKEFGIDVEDALRMSCGFGGGMGGQGETCGAVSGAYMLIGLKYGKVDLDDSLAMEKTDLLVREFAELFKKRNEHTLCIELLGLDLLIEESSVISKRFHQFCPKMVKDAVEIIEELLELE